jgi:hypothetical protein
MLINKTQGQALKELGILGICLRKGFFLHMWFAQNLVLQKACIYWRQQEKYQM